MPTSKPLFLNQFCDLIMLKRPRTILDVGFGYGKFGFLAREFSDAWNFPQESWNGEKFEHVAKIEGIEIYEKYINDLHREIYDEIHVGDVIDILPKLPNYDFIIAADVIEHFEKQAAVGLMDTLRNKSKTAVVITPVRVLMYGAYYGNVYETHRCQFSREELEKYGKVYENGGAHMVVMEEQ